MKHYKQLLLLFLFVFGLFACENQMKDSDKKPEEKTTQKQRPSALENDKFFTIENKKFLYGGEDSSDHFDITNSILVDSQYHYGIGREAFPALLDPEFISISQADSLWDDGSRFLLAHKGDEVKAYSVKDLMRHEVVNDTIDGTAIMAAYCVLADLGAIYKRNYGNQILTFALSGYTYYDSAVWDGLDGFVLWDRETESLWWPLIGKAVSGPLKGVQLLEMNDKNWEDLNWKDVKEKYPDAMVLKSGQDFERPKNWQTLQEVETIVDNYSE